MNANERIAYEALVASGCTVLRRGWPDFLVVRPEGAAFALEWKERGDPVTPDQETMHDVLTRLGIPVLVTGSLIDLYKFRPVVTLNRRSRANAVLRRERI